MESDYSLVNCLALWARPPAAAAEDEGAMNRACYNFNQPVSR
jgi:hypothetical protein